MNNRRSTSYLLVATLLWGCSSEDSDANSNQEMESDDARWDDDERWNGNRGDDNMSGDGGDNDGDEEPNSDPGMSDPATCVAQEEWDPSWVAWEEEVLQLVNERRAEGASCGGEEFSPTGPLSMNTALQCAARLHSMDMDDQDYFSHTSLDGRSPWDRIEDAGFQGNAGGENIAAGQRSPEGVMNSWMGSSGHCSAIMNPGYEFIGVGYHPDHLWTQTFGSN